MYDKENIMVARGDNGRLLFIYILSKVHKQRSYDQ